MEKWLNEVISKGQEGEFKVYRAASGYEFGSPSVDPKTIARYRDFWLKV